MANDLETRVAWLEGTVHDLIEILKEAQIAVLALQGALLKSGSLDQETYREKQLEVKARVETVRAALDPSKTDRALDILKRFEAPEQ